MRSLGGVVADAHYDRQVQDGHLSATLDLRLPVDLGPTAVLNAFDGLSGIRRIRLEPPA